ncbi:MAG: dienelactone hydrolase family protein [Acidobacteria bacterium]|nr:dienelactone hydrolase family protein [Acidobacteriota bacterium]
MLKAGKGLFIGLIICIFLAISVIAQNGPATNDNLGTSRITSPPVGTTAGQSRRTGADPVDDRVELREYLFTDTGEMLPYAVFVSTKVAKDKKAPLVLALHGFSGNHGTFMRTQCVDEAEKNGYILVGAMGYSPSGSFGMPMRRPTGAPPKMNSPVPKAPAKPGDGAARDGQPKPGMFTGMQGGPGGTKETDPARVAELSEKDAMNVLEMTRKEFNIDDNRIYLMGHSLGGGGALHMGEKYSSIWAAVAGLAPAAFGFQWSEDQKLKNVPLLIIVGDEDRLVTGSQQLADQLKGLNFRVEYKSLPGLDHGEIIGGSMPDVFKFFNEHTRPGSK